MTQKVPSDAAFRLGLLLVLPYTAVPAYLALIWLTPPELRPYWAGVWLLGSVMVHIVNPVAGTGGSGGMDQPPTDDIEYILLMLRSSLLWTLPLAGCIFLVGKKLFG